MSCRQTLQRAARLAPLWLLVTFGLPCGCQSGAKGEGGPTAPASRSSSGSAASDYEAGLYASAYTKAMKEAGASSGARHERAALIAGMSAHALNRNDDAERWVAPLTKSQDREVAGRATATLGLIEQERGRHARAAQLLNEAAGMLSGDEAVRARAAADHSMRGQQSGATTTSATPTARGSLGPFTLQLGAFSNRGNADSMARSAKDTSRRAGLGEPQVSTDVDSKGRALWVVRVGAFPSRAAAMRGQRSFPKAIVVQTARGN